PPFVGEGRTSVSSVETGEGRASIVVPTPNPSLPPSIKGEGVRLSRPLAPFPRLVQIPVCTRERTSRCSVRFSSIISVPRRQPRRHQFRDRSWHFSRICQIESLSESAQGRRFSFALSEQRSVLARHPRALPWADVLPPFRRTCGLKGRNKLVQGNALGIRRDEIPVALKGRKKSGQVRHMLDAQ